MKESVKELTTQTVGAVYDRAFFVESTEKNFG